MTYEWHNQDSRIKPVDVAATLNLNAEGREGHLVLETVIYGRDYKSATTLALGQMGIPRRLTPVECERLMGWPDGHTDVPDSKGKPAADTARYKACGNGVASPVAAWIGFRLKEALQG
jgi:site-specific DNA-cytosine methylase